MALAISNSRFTINSSQFLNINGEAPQVIPTGSVYRYNVTQVGAYDATLNYNDAYGNPAQILNPDPGIYYIIAQSGSLTDQYINLTGTLTSLTNLLITAYATESISFTEQTFISSNAWTKPAGVTQIIVECWGAGGAGGGATSNNSGGGGGGGGQYVRSVLTYPSASQNINYSLSTGTTGTTGNGASGSSTSWDGGIVLAVGGGGGIANNGAGGSGNLSGSIGTIIYYGGNGASGVSSTLSGGGGAGAGSVQGYDSSPTASGITPGGRGWEEGGQGGSGSAAVSINGNAGALAGGGGGGGYRTTAGGGGNRNGGNGGSGEIRIIYR